MAFSPYGKRKNHRKKNKKEPKKIKRSYKSWEELAKQVKIRRLK